MVNRQIRQEMAVAYFKILSQNSPRMTDKNFVGDSGYQLAYPRIELETYRSKTQCAAVTGNYPRSILLIPLSGSSNLTNTGPNS